MMHRGPTWFGPSSASFVSADWQRFRSWNNAQGRPHTHLAGAAPRSLKPTGPMLEQGRACPTRQRPAGTLGSGGAPLLETVPPTLVALPPRPTSVDFLIAPPYNLRRSGAGAVNPDARWKPQQRRQRPNQRSMHGRRDPFRMCFGMARAHLGAAALA